MVICTASGASAQLIGTTPRTKEPHGGADGAKRGYHPPFWSKGDHVLVKARGGRQVRDSSAREGRELTHLFEV
jgi:hypothetical protein